MWETPVPIPHTTVKTQAADGTALETVWESRWPPDYKKFNMKKEMNWFLPVIKDQKRFWLLMTDKHQSDMYFENCIQK